MAVDWQAVQEKWARRWVEEKIFEPKVENGRKKFFVTFPYPYVNSLLHIGHLYTLMRVEAFARYKRMQGYNVLFPQGWHATGSPIISAAERVREREPKQIRILKDAGIEDNDILNFEKPEYWLDYFIPKALEDYKRMGMSIDWRRQFYTTSLNPQYDKFIRWQFRKLKEKGHVIKGKFPVVWCPKDRNAVSDHSRSEGEGETPKDFIWGKFRLRDSDLLLMAGTTRPDAFLGQTHLWIDPEGDYVIVKVKDEKWVVGREAVQKIKDQYAAVTIVKSIRPGELMGKWVQGPLVNYEVYIVPGWFIDSKVGSGIVYSALEDPVDLIEIQDIQKDLGRLKKYKLDLDVIKKLKPISIIDVPGMSDNLGQDMINKYKIASVNDKKKVKEAKDELNKTIFRKGVMKKNCGAYAGLLVPEAQEAIKKDLIKSNDAVMFYELTGKVICRCLTECIVKIVDDQWFITYGNKRWKKEVHDAFNGIKLYPEKSRQQFEYVVDWLHNWACTRETGLGTRLPWDEKWLIESLSDSTIYMAYYTIAHIIKDVDPERIDDSLFDYVFLGKNTKLNVDRKTADRMRKEFTYWYPCDFRNSGKDLIQNHLAFYVFNHTAIFPQKHWPKGIGVNGWVTVDGQKMSKSLGNMIPLRDMPQKFTVDTARFTILNGGEDMDDPNWDSNLATALKTKLDQLYEFSIENYNKGRAQKLKIDRWMESQLNSIVMKATAQMEETVFRSALQSIYFDLQQAVKWYSRRCAEFHKGTVTKVIEAQLLMLAPFTPFICEELWKKLGKKGYISQASWPKGGKVDSSLDLGEELVKNTLEDIHAVLKLVSMEKPAKITLFVAAPWKYALFALLAKEMKKTQDPGKVLRLVMSHKEMKPYGQEISRIVPKIVQSRKIPLGMDSQDEEYEYLREASAFLEKEICCSLMIKKSGDHPKAKAAMPGKVGVLVE